MEGNARSLPRREMSALPPQAHPRQRAKNAVAAIAALSDSPVPYRGTKTLSSARAEIADDTPRASLPITSAARRGNE